MAVIAVYSSKGGVGKTTLAVNLAWASATISARRTLLWDLDAQAAATFILAPKGTRRTQARRVIEREQSPEENIVATAVPQLDLLPADASLRTLDLLFAELDANKRLLRIGEALGKRYDRIIVDCPPGLGVTAEQIIRSAALIVVPVIPSALATRAADELAQYLGSRRKAAPPVLPVFNLVDRRRAAHRTALGASPHQPFIPMASAVEQMADRQAPVGAFAPRSPAVQAIRSLWASLERRLLNMSSGASAGEAVS